MFGDRPLSTGIVWKPEYFHWMVPFNFPNFLMRLRVTLNPITPYGVRCTNGINLSSLDAKASELQSPWKLARKECFVFNYDQAKGLIIKLSCEKLVWKLAPYIIAVDWINEGFIFNYVRCMVHVEELWHLQICPFPECISSCLRGPNGDVHWIA